MSDIDQAADGYRKTIDATLESCAKATKDHGYSVLPYECSVAQECLYHLMLRVAELAAENASLRAQHAELNAELLDLARRYDPNCEVYVYEDQADAMDAARQTVEAMQQLADFLGRDPEGCLVDCADEAMGRIEKAEERIDALEAENERLKREDREWRRTIKECERIVGAEGTAENGLTCNMPNIIRDLKIDNERLRKQAARFEDDAPVDEAWLRSIGFSIRPDDHGFTLRLQLDNCGGWMRYLECCDRANIPDTPWEIASYYKDGTDERAMIVDKITTRRQLNHLLAALTSKGDRDE